MNKPTCILCDEPESIDGLCESHNDEFCDTTYGVTLMEWLRVKIAAIRTAALAYMENAQSECDHLRMRARQALSGEIPVQHLANSVIVHTNNIAKESYANFKDPREDAADELTA